MRFWSFLNSVFVAIIINVFLRIIRLLKLKGRICDSLGHMTISCLIYIDLFIFCFIPQRNSVA